MNKIDKNIIPKDFEELESNYINIFLICDWIDSKTLCDNWNKMSKGNYIWNKINLVWKEPCDYYCIINNFPKDFKIIPEKTIFFQMKPDKNILINNIYLEKFKYVGYHDYFLNNLTWNLSKTYQQLSNDKIEKDDKLNNIIATIVDDSYKYLGDIKKVDFIKFLEKKDVNIHVYGGKNKFLWKNYKESNENCYLEYKYTFDVEDISNKNYCTQRLIDGILSETLVFYSGCYNIKESIDPRAYIYLELNNFEEDFNIIKKAIKEDLWSQRIKYIKEAKYKILNELQFFPRLEQILNNEYKFTKNMLENEKTKIENIKCKETELKFKNFDDYDFYPNKDSFGGDISFYENKNIEELKNLADNDKNCVAFNTYGYLKNILQDKENFIELKDRSLQIEGLYVKKKYKKNNIEKISEISLEEKLKNYKFFSGFDHHNDDICYIENADLNKMIEYCENNEDCISFNTLGFMKNNFNENNLKKSNYFTEKDGIYVNIEKYKKLNQIKYHNINNIIRNHKIYCINLDRRKDRKEVMEKKFQELKIQNYEFYKAIDGQSLMLTDDIKNIFIGNDFSSNRKIIGKSLSHYNIWKELENSINDYFIIFEDDIKIDTLFNNIINIINGVYTINSEWDIIYIGYTMFDSNSNNNLNIYKNDKNIESINIDKLNLDIYIGGLFSYVLSKNGAKKLCNFIKINGIKHNIDYIVKKYHDKIQLNQYEIRPHLVNTDLYL